MTPDKQKAQKLIKQTSGTLEKIQRMIESDTYCPEIIQQVDSALGMVHTARIELLRGHLSHCLADRLKANKDQTIEELIKIYKLSHS